MDEGFFFSVLGPLSLRRNGVPVPLGGPRQRAVLAVLILQEGRPVSIDRICEEIWSGAPPPSAATTVRGYVSHLRKALRPAAALVRGSAGYELRVAPEQLDAYQFEQLTAEGRALLGTDPAAAAKLLREALDLWRGPALADFSGEPFARAHCTRWEELRATALEARIDADLAVGRHADLVGELRLLLGEYPLRERLHAQRMLALYRCGRQAEALDAYREAYALLVEALGIDPGPALRELETAILRQAPELDWIPPDEPAAAGGGFVGRAAELGQLAEAYAAARLGAGRLVLVSGEAGIGKTRLAREFAERSRRLGADVYWGRAWEEEGAPPFWPWSQILRAWSDSGRPLGPEAAVLADALAPADASPGARFRLFDVVTRALTTLSDRPAVLILDDLHRADVPSLRLLQFLARSLATSRLLVLAAHRPADGVLSDVVAELAREPVTRRLDLHGLGRAEVGAYLATLTTVDVPVEVVAALGDRTGGNPFFLGELARLAVNGPELAALVDVVPQGVLAAVGRRLAGIPAAARTVLSVAAVHGRDCVPAVLSAVCTVDPPELIATLEAAARAGFLIETPGPGFRFAHELVRAALYQSLGPGTRARLHRQVGLALERLYGAECTHHLAELAHHFRQGALLEDDGRATDYLTRSAEQATALCAYEEAIRLFDDAVASTRADPTRCALLLSLADVQVRAGETVSARATYRRALELCRGLDDADRFARAVLGLVNPIDFGVYEPELIDLLAEALTRLGPGRSTMHILTQARLAMALYWHPADSGRSRELSEQAVASARELGDRRVLAQALHAYRYTVWGSEHLPLRLAIGAEIASLAGICGDAELVLNGCGWRLADLAERGDFGEVDREIARYESLAERLRLPEDLLWTSLWRGMRAQMSGRFAEAEARARAVLSGGREALGVRGLQAGTLLLWAVRREQGRLSELDDGLRQLVTQAPDLSWRVPLTLNLAVAGQRHAAQEELDRFLGNGFAQVPSAVRLPSLTFLAEVSRRLGDRTAAGILYRELLPYQDHCSTVYGIACFGSVRYDLACLADVLGDRDAAQRHVIAAIAVNRRIGAQPYLAKSLALARQLSFPHGSHAVPTAGWSTGSTDPDRSREDA